MLRSAKLMGTMRLAASVPSVSRRVRPAPSRRVTVHPASRGIPCSGPVNACFSAPTGTSATQQPPNVTPVPRNVPPAFPHQPTASPAPRHTNCTPHK
jgi:hypothetical protein